MPPTLLQVANLQATLQWSASQAPVVVTVHPARAVEGLVGSHSRHRWHAPKSKWEEALVWERQGGVDSGKRLFSYQRVIANAISCEHQCLWNMNRTPPSPTPSPWDPSSPWPQGEAKGLLIDTAKGSALSSVLQLGTQLPSCPPAQGSTQA